MTRLPLMTQLTLASSHKNDYDVLHSRVLRLSALLFSLACRVANAQGRITEDNLTVTSINT